jgi:hypothetical protein
MNLTQHIFYLEGFEHTSTRKLRGLFSNHEAAVTVDPTMARRLQSCWPFRAFQEFFPPMPLSVFTPRIIGEKNAAINRILGQG